MNAQNYKPINQLVRITGTLILLALCLTARAQQNHIFTDKQGLAIRGYDPVAYFKEQQPVKGSSAYRLEWAGALWQFKDEANLNAFKMDPEKFAPQYGGYCAFGVSEDHKSPTDPSAWTVVDDKLYLNYNGKVRDQWRKDTDGRIRKADMYWIELKDKE